MSLQTINTPRDTTLQATNTALGLLAKDATIGATNTALGLLGKDASLQDIKAALLQIVAALDPTADDYDQLSNKPQVNGVTLSGNKTSKQLGIRQTIPLTSAQYAQLTSAEKMDVDKDYIITDENATAAPIDDDSVSRNKVWSSYKVDEELDTLSRNMAVTSDVIASSLSLFKMGKLRILQLNGCTSAAGGAITTLSNSDAPTTGITIPIVAYVSSKFFDGYLQISTSGSVVAKYFTENTASQWAVPAGGLVYGNATWFAG